MWFLTLLEIFSPTTKAKQLIEYIRGGRVLNVYDKKQKTLGDAIKMYLKHEFGEKQKKMFLSQFKFPKSRDIKLELKNRYLKALNIPNKFEKIHLKYFDTWDNAILSSSWLIAGSYSRHSKTLEITTIQGKSYIYPNVEISIWNVMKSAAGKNGTGAGTMFWRYYLKPKGWLKSDKRKYIKENISDKFYKYWEGAKTKNLLNVPEQKRHTAKKIYDLNNRYQRSLI